MNILGKFFALFQDRPVPRAGRVDQATLEDRPEHWDEVAVGKVEALRQSITGSRTTLAILTAALGLLAPKIKAEVSPSDIDGALAIAGNILSGIAGLRAIWTNAQRRWEPTAREVIKPGFTGERGQRLAKVLEQRRGYKRPVTEEGEEPWQEQEEPIFSEAPESFPPSWLGIITRRADEIGCAPDVLVRIAATHRANGGTLGTLASQLPHSFNEIAE